MKQYDCLIIGSGTLLDLRQPFMPAELTYRRYFYEGIQPGGQLITTTEIEEISRVIPRRC